MKDLERRNQTQIREEVVYSGENCGVVDRREIDGKKMERKARLKKTKKKRG